MPRAIVIFARTPEAEASAKCLPVETSAFLFEAVIASWLRAAAAHGATPIIACKARHRERLSRIAPDVDRRWVEQQGRDFGERLAHATGAAFRAGFRSVMVTGIDAPVPGAGLLAAAFDRLENGAVEAVIAPSHDGGINLIGLAAPAPELLVTIAPGHRDVVRRCRRFFQTLHILPAASDINRRSDLATTQTEPAWCAFAALIAACLLSDSVESPRARPSGRVFWDRDRSRAPPSAA